MAKHIGIVACSAEGASLCYRTICAEAPLLMGEHMHPEISMHTHPLGEYMVHIRAGNWKGVDELMLSSANKFSKLAILGTKYLMVGPVYPKTSEKFDISYEIPGEKDREQIDKIIFNELVSGIFIETSRLYFNQVIQKLKNRGCDAAILGCTEIPIIVNPGDCPLPTLDSTRLLARAALKNAIKNV